MSFLTNLANRIEYHIKLDDGRGYYLSRKDQEAVVWALRIADAEGSSLKSSNGQRFPSGPEGLAIPRIQAAKESWVDPANQKRHGYFGFEAVGAPDEEGCVGWEMRARDNRAIDPGSYVRQ